MPLYKTNKDIFKTHKEEVYENRFFNSNTLCLPKNKKWDYKRELKIEDIEIWEVIFEDSWGLGVYAAYDPYAEFYMIKYASIDGNKVIDTFYGQGSQNKIIKFMLDNNVPFQLNNVWIDNDEMWLHDTTTEEKKIIII